MEASTSGLDEDAYGRGESARRGRLKMAEPTKAEQRWLAELLSE